MASLYGNKNENCPCLLSRQVLTYLQSNPRLLKHLAGSAPRIRQPSPRSGRSAAAADVLKVKGSVGSFNGLHHLIRGQAEPKREHGHIQDRGGGHISEQKGGQHKVRHKQKMQHKCQSPARSLHSEVSEL